MSAPVTRTLREALGDGARAPDFEQYLVDYQGMLRSYDHVSSPEVRQLVRFMHLFSVAAVEGAREATIAAGDTPQDAAHTISLMVKAAAVSIGCAICSVLDDATPADVVREVMQTFWHAGIDEVIRTQGLK